VYVKDRIKLVNNYWKDIFENYAIKLGYNQDQIEIYFEMVESIDTLLRRNNTQEKAMKWDKEGVKLIKGDVVLPKGFEKILLEIVRDNEINNIFVPEEMGGLGYTSYFSGPLVETIARHDLSLGLMIMAPMIVLDPLLQNYKDNFEPIIKKLAEGRVLSYVAFTEANAGSNLQSVKSTSVLEGDDYVLNGSKIFITNGGYAETGIFLARNMVDGMTEGHNAFIVDSMEGISTSHLEYKSGIKASPTAQLQFDDVRVPKENLIGEAGTGYHNVIERLLSMRTSIGFQATATSKRSFELALDYANTREQFGKTIINFPDIKRKLNLMERQIKRLDDFAYLTSHNLDRYYRGLSPVDVGANGDRKIERKAVAKLPLDLRTGIIHYFVSGLKIYSSEIVNYLLYDAQQVFGGMGFVAETEINKIARDVRILPIFDGTSEIHNWIINRSQKAINHIPNFTKPITGEDTEYETMMYLRYPDLRSNLRD
jgi:alkylation response protein AidB-like acyl-CoA dehydrogenase